MQATLVATGASSHGVSVAKCIEWTKRSSVKPGWAAEAPLIYSARENAPSSRNECTRRHCCACKEQLKAGISPRDSNTELQTNLASSK